MNFVLVNVLVCGSGVVVVMVVWLLWEEGFGIVVLEFGVCVLVLVVMFGELVLVLLCDVFGCIDLFVGGVFILCCIVVWGDVDLVILLYKVIVMSGVVLGVEFVMLVLIGLEGVLFFMLYVMLLFIDVFVCWFGWWEVMVVLVDFMLDVDV